MHLDSIMKLIQKMVINLNLNFMIIEKEKLLVNLRQLVIKFRVHGRQCKLEGMEHEEEILNESVDEKFQSEGILLNK